MDIFNRTMALEMLGDEEELLVELMESFVNDKKLDSGELAALEKKDRTEAASYVHYYKGAARQLAVEKLAFSGQNLEDVLRGKKEGDIEELNRIFVQDYNDALAELKNQLTKIH